MSYVGIVECMFYIENDKIIIMMMIPMFVYVAAVACTNAPHIHLKPSYVFLPVVRSKNEIHFEYVEMCAR